MKQNNPNVFFFLSFTFLSFFLFFSEIQAQNTIGEAKHLLRISDGVNSPLRIAIDSDDVVYVTDAVGRRICKYDSSGDFLEYLDVDGSPLAIAVGFQDIVYVGDRVSGEFKLLDASGRLLKKIETDMGGFELPSSAVIDDEYCLYVVDSKRKSISVFDAYNNYVTSFGSDMLIYPTGIAFDQKNQRILVAEHGGLDMDSPAGLKLIHAFDKQGNWLTSFAEYGSEQGQFTRIQGITVDHWGRIYVTDPYQGSVTVLKENGVFLATIGEFGSEQGQLNAPMDVALDSRNRLWVVSMNNGSLEIFDINQIPTPVIKRPPPTLPLQSELLQNYPNPFNPGTWIPFRLNRGCQVTINIYNEIGKTIRTFRLGQRQAGSYLSAGRAVYWDGTNRWGKAVSSGIYFYEIRADDFVAVRRMSVVK